MSSSSSSIIIIYYTLDSVESKRGVVCLHRFCFCFFYDTSTALVLRIVIPLAIKYGGGGCKQCSASTNFGSCSLS